MLVDRRGGSLVEYLVVVGLVALLALAGFRLFGSTLRSTATAQAACVAALDASACAQGQGKESAPTFAVGGTPSPGDAPAGSSGGGAFDALHDGMGAVADFVRCGPTGCPPGSSVCFAAGTPVLTPGGLRPIEALGEGDLVVAHDPSTGETAARRVVGTKVTHGADVLALTLVGEAGTPETIRATPQHPFYVEDRGWVAAGELAIGEAMLSSGTESVEVAALEPAGATTVYNIEVEGFHTYFVGAARALVHNDCDAEAQRLRQGVYLRNPVWSGHSDDLVAAILIRDQHFSSGGWRSARDLIDGKSLPLPAAPEGTTPETRTDLDKLAKKVGESHEDLKKVKAGKDHPDARWAAAQRLRDDLIRYYATVDAVSGGGQIRYDDNGKTKFIRYPNGTTLDVGWQGDKPTSVKYTEPDGTVTRVYRPNTTTDIWQVDVGAGDKDPVSFQGRYEFDTDGRIWRYSAKQFVLLSPDGTQTGGRTAPDLHELPSDIGGGIKVHVKVRDGSVEIAVEAPKAGMASQPIKIPYEGEVRPKIVSTKDDVILISLDGSDKPHVGVQATLRPWGEGQKFRDRKVPYFKGRDRVVLENLPRGTNELSLTVVTAKERTQNHWVSPLPADQNYMIPPYWERSEMDYGKAVVQGWSRGGYFVGDTTGFDRQVGDLLEAYQLAYGRGMPVLGTLVMAGETIVGTEITGRKMTGKERAWHGAFAALGAVLEFGPLAATAAQEARAVAQIQKASGLTRAEAKALLVETQALGVEERALLKLAAEGKVADPVKLAAVTDRLNRAVAGARPAIPPAELLARAEAMAGRPAAAGAIPAKEAVSARFAKTNPNLEKALHDMLDDAAHKLNVIESLKDPATRARTLDLIDDMAAGRALGTQSLDDFLKANPGKGSLFEPVAAEVNATAGGQVRKTVFVEGLKAEVPAMRAGAKVSELEMKGVRDYARYLKETVEPSVSKELDDLVRELNREFGGGASYSVRTKSADGLIDKVERMTTGTAGRGVRPDYKVGDVIDGVGGRITVENMEQLARVLEKVKAKFGTGDGGRILEIENMYASPKPSSPRYRVIPLIVKSKDGKATFELQLTTRRASVAADLDHNIGYKPLIPATDAQKELIRRMQAEAAALEQLESLGRRALPLVPEVPKRSPLPSPGGLGPAVRPPDGQDPRNPK